MQNKGTLCPSFVHYFTPGGPIETDEVTLHSVLFLGLYMCRECFQGVSLSYLLNEKLSGTSLPNINTSPPIGMSQRALQYIKSDYSAPQELKGQHAIPFFLTECSELCLLVQPSFSPLLRAGFKDCFV